MSKDEKDENKLLDHALDSGAQVINDFPNTHGIRDVLGDEKINFYPELSRVEFDSLLNQRFKINAYQFIEKWEGTFGVSDYYLLMVTKDDGNDYTTLGGGRAIVNQISKLSRRRGAFPVVVELHQRMGAGGLYYIFE